MDGPKVLSGPLEINEQCVSEIFLVIVQKGKAHMLKGRKEMKGYEHKVPY